MVLIVTGKKHYRDSPADPMLLRVGKCVVRAVKMRFNSTGSSKKVEHWVDRATLPGEGQVTDSALIIDVKKTLEVLLLFTTYPLFWALFYQTSTGMIFQVQFIMQHGINYVETYGQRYRTYLTEECVFQRERESVTKLLKITSDDIDQRF